MSTAAVKPDNQTRRQSNPIDADVKRRADEFLATNPALAKKLDDLDRLLMGHFLQAQLQEERNGWRGSLAKAMGELERLRKLSLKAGGAAPTDTAEEEYQLRRQFSEIMDVQEIESETSNAQQTEGSKAPEPVPYDEAALRLQAQLGEAHREANAAKELAWHYDNLIHELKAINAKLEGRLTQLVLERRRCFKLLPPTQGGQENGDLYKAIRELQNRHEQLTREQHEELERLHQHMSSSAATANAAAAADSQHQQQPTQQVCATCGSVLSSTPRSDGPPQQQHQYNEKQQQQQQSNSAAIGRKHQRKVGRLPSKPIDVAILPLRPKWQQQLQQQQQQQQQQQKPVVDQPPAVLDSNSAQLQERLTEAQAENGHLLRELQSLGKALRAAEDEAKEKAERLAAYEKQVASMKLAYTYRQQEPATVAEIIGGGGLPVLNLRQTHKRSSQQLLQQQQQQQQPLSERQHVMPAKTSVTRCLRCQKLYRLVDNNKFACKYHSKGKQRQEQHNNSLGKLGDILFVWDCCGRLANAEGCCYSEHI